MSRDAERPNENDEAVGAFLKFHTGCMTTRDPANRPAEMREFLVSVNWAGTDFRLDNGATRVVPGSHRWPEHRIATESEIYQAVMPKGSAVVWLSRTLHGAGRSTSNEGRTAFFASYVADWVRQEENQYLTVPPEIAAKLSERAQQMIGYQCSDLVGWVKGRSKKNLLQEGKSGNL